MAPLVVKERVLVGASGGEFGIYGWVKALDLKSGAIVWTARNIGPDADMLAKPGDFKAPYDSGADLGTHSWAEDTWRTGGAPVWGWMSYDPELDLVYYGTGNASPYNAEQRLGDNKWTASVLARRPADGRWCGPTSSRRTTTGTTTPPEPWCWRIWRSAANRPRPWCTSTRTALPTRSIAPPAACCSRSPLRT